MHAASTKKQQKMKRKTSWTDYYEESPKETKIEIDTNATRQGKGKHRKKGRKNLAANGNGSACQDWKKWETMAEFNDDTDWLLKKDDWLDEASGKDEARERKEQEATKEKLEVQTIIRNWRQRQAAAKAAAEMKKALKKEAGRLRTANNRTLALEKRRIALEKEKLASTGLSVDTLASSEKAAVPKPKEKLDKTPSLKTKIREEQVTTVSQKNVVKASCGKKGKKTKLTGCVAEKAAVPKEKQDNAAVPKPKQKLDKTRNVKTNIREDKVTTVSQKNLVTVSSAKKTKLTGSVAEKTAVLKEKQDNKTRSVKKNIRNENVTTISPKKAVTASSGNRPKKTKHVV
jgi:hypothetical protein